MLDKQKTVIALGCFDSVHLGHQKVIKTAKKHADENGLTLTVFTFSGNLKAIINNSEEKNVYLPFERETLLKNLGADHIYFAPITKEFLSTDRKVFLDELNKKYDISCYVSGVDYTFGAFGKGDAQYLTDYAKSHNQKHIVVETLNMFDEKISTTLIKEHLNNGEIDKANALLGRPFSVSGKVVKDRQVGKKLGFPTANLKLENDKICVKDGVYVGKTKVDSKEYLSIVNCGNRPTFNVDARVIESHLIDFDGDIYGKQIEICFLEYLRDIKKFESKIKLIEQLSIDIEKAKEKNYD